MIEVRNANCVFHPTGGGVVRALDSVSTSIGDGEFVCMLGRSGHGKSTLLRALAGLQPLTSGEIRVNDKIVTGPGYDRGMVFQEDTVFPWLSVKSNVEFGLRARGIPTAKQSLIADHWVDAVGLAPVAKSWPKELSGGMRKRVAIAAVFANEAPILLMDEPFGPLDYVTRRDLQGLLVALWKDTRKTIVFVTHDIEEALILADRILIMRRGKIVDDISVHLVRPRDEEVRASREALSITKAIQGHLELGHDSGRHSAVKR
jgi:NitT/TauT family transport system ATP-binding protein